MTDNTPTPTPIARSPNPTPNTYTERTFTPNIPNPTPIPPQVSLQDPISTTSTTTPIPAAMANDATPNNTAMPPSIGSGGGSGTPSADATAAQNATVPPGGAPARVYMNEKIVPYLLEGMKGVTKEQPSNPLRVLGEFLLQKSAEVEGAQGQSQSGKTQE